MYKALTGHPKVDAIAYIKFEGDITPKSWYKHIVYQTSKGETKVDRLAIDILSDIIYWYRPHEKRHEVTGESIGWQKKFKGDELHRSVDAFAEVLNTTPRCIRESIKVLEKLGLVKAIYKPVYTKYGCLPNVMHIDINPEAIAAITYRPNSNESPETIEKSLLTKWVTSGDETVDENYETSKDQLRKRAVEATKSTAHPYIEISSEISSEISPLTPQRGEEGVHESKADDFQQEQEEESEAVVVEAEIVTEEEIKNKIDPSVENGKQLIQSIISNPGVDLGSALACDNNAIPAQKLERIKRNIELLDSGKVERLPRYEFNEVAEYVIGPYASLYRKSGKLNNRRSVNDIKPEFLEYVEKVVFSRGVRNEANAVKYVRNSELNPDRWDSLIADVKGWLKQEYQNLGQPTQTPKEKHQTQQELRKMMLSTRI